MRGIAPAQVKDAKDFGLPRRRRHVRGVRHDHLYEREVTFFVIPGRATREPGISRFRVWC
jgi:hypothetical protein